MIATCHNKVKTESGTESGNFGQDRASKIRTKVSPRQSTNPHPLQTSESVRHFAAESRYAVYNTKRSGVSRAFPTPWTGKVS